MNLILKKNNDWKIYDLKSSASTLVGLPIFEVGVWDWDPVDKSDLREIFFNLINRMINIFFVIIKKDTLCPLLKVSCFSKKK
jgi:hypothetical protein